MSAVITPFEGTELFNTASFNNRISQINTGFSYISNPNLLDNWHFQIWQRYSNGNYSGVPNTIYVADRWIITSSNGAIKSNLTKATPYGGIKNATGPNCRITQRLENAAQFNGMTLTLSLLKNTGLYTSTKVANGWNDTTDIFDVFSFQTSWLSARETILAAKLELGSTQTLAHQEGDKWVLNEVPNYGEQLRRCQRYAIDLAASGDRKYGIVGVGVAVSQNKVQFMVPLPTTMRARPIVKFSGTWKCVHGTDVSSGLPVTTISVDRLSTNTVALDTFTDENLITGDTYMLWRSNDSNNSLFLSADL